MNKFLKPLREKREEIAKDPARVIAILKQGANLARAQVSRKMGEVRAKVGIDL